MKNVAILMQSRTGSSLVAAIFRAHGWHTGGENVRVTNRAGKPAFDYVSYENRAIRNHLVHTYGAPLKEPARPTYDMRLVHIVDALPQPWAFKGDIYYAEIFRATCPDMAWIYVKRDIEDAIASSMDRRVFPVRRGEVEWGRHELEAELRSFLAVKYWHMDNLRDAHGGLIVDATEVMAGELSSVRLAIEYAGGAWDEALALGAFDVAPELQ